MTRDLPLGPAQWATFPGEGEPAHLAPANGFPPQVYAPLLARLSDRLAPFALMPYAMRAPIPPPRDLEWSALADEMAHHLQQRGARDLVGLGHSLGGVLTLMAAVRHPGLFRQLVLMDPVFLPPWILLAMRALRLIRQEHRFYLAQRARRRRRVFPDRATARLHYRNRGLFRNWDTAALDAYVQYGLRPRGDGRVELAYDPAWEAAIFARVPVDVWRWIRRAGQEGLTAVILYGEHSEIYRPSVRRRLRQMWPQARLVCVPGHGHMFPMEAPTITAQLMQKMWPTSAQMANSPCHEASNSVQ